MNKKLLAVLALSMALSTGAALAGCGGNSGTDSSTPVDSSTPDESTPSVVTYSVTFNSNGGSAVQMQTVEEGDTATEPTAPTKVGYTFAGWTVNGSAYDFSSAVVANIELTATWTANTNTAYVVEVYAENLDGTYSLQTTMDKTGTTDSTVTYAVSDIVVPTGFELDADNENSVATGVVAADGSLALKAYLNRKVFTVTVEENGGSVVEDYSVKYGATISAPASAKLGYTVAWDYDFTQPVTDNVTVTATWTANTDTAYAIEVYLESVDGTYSLQTTMDKTGTTDSAVSYAQSDIEVPTGFELDADNENSVATGIVAADGSLALKAYLNRKVFTVTVEENGGSSVEDYSVKYGAKVSAPSANTEKAGYTFVGWANEDGSAFDFEQTAESAYTLYACWTLALEKITINLADEEHTFNVSKLGTITAISYDEGAFAEDEWSVDEGVLTISKDKMSSLTIGKTYTLTLYIGKYETVTMEVLATKIIALTQAMVDNNTFESTIEANMSANFVLASDLDFTDKQPTPIGSNAVHFTGTFDGQGYTIKNYTGYPDNTVYTGDPELGWRSFIYCVGKGGVVKNLGMEYTNAYWRSVAPIAYNHGTIENVYVSAAYTRADISGVTTNTWNAGLVSINGGTIKNCITNVSFTDSKVTVAGAIAFENGSSASVENCYAVSNVAISVVNNGEGAVSGCEVFANTVEMFNAISGSLTAENGWANIWSVAKATETGLSKNTLKFGAAELVTIAYLSSGIESKLESIVESNMSGYYVLTSNLDFNGIATQPIGNANNHFTGTIDGQGYTIKNYVGGASTDNADGGVAARSFIAYVGAGGVVKNLGLEYTNQYWTRMAPIGGNYGTLENLYFKTNFPRATLTNDATNITGGITSVNYAGSVVRNCIVDVTFAATAITSSNTGAAVGRNINGTIQNCYAVCNVTALKIAKTKEGTAKETNVGVYANVTDLVAAQSANVTTANGWASYWKVADGAIVFGNN